MTKRNNLKIVPPQGPSTKFKIPVPKAPIDDLYPSFCFRHYHRNGKKYCIEKLLKTKEHIWLFHGLHDISQMKWRDLKQSHVFHAHEVNWDDTAEKNGFNHLPQPLQEIPPFQIAPYGVCRIFGFFDEKNSYNIVWIDREHKIYPDGRF
jgi:hypothetical protein